MTGMFSNVFIPKEIPICRGCSQGKMMSSSFPESMTRATAPFDLIHMDLKTIHVLSYHKYKYIITFLDDHTSHGWITLLKNKSDTYKVIDHFIAMVEMQYKSRVWAFMSDFGGEFSSLKLKERLKELGIRVQHSVPHMPQQNGRAECFNWTLFEKAEAMCHQTCLPKSWWEFCIEYTIHVYNRTPIICLKHKTPYEAINRSKPDISHLRILGCGAYVFLQEDVQQDALSPCAEFMTFIGFTSSVKGWKFMRNTNTIFHAMKAVFDENMYPQCPDGSHVNIPAIETGVLLLPDGYLDRDDNIPLEYDDAPHPPPPVESDPVWHPPRPQGYYHRMAGSNGHQSTPGDSSPSIPPSLCLSYKTPS